MAQKWQINAESLVPSKIGDLVHVFKVTPGHESNFGDETLVCLGYLRQRVTTEMREAVFIGHTIAVRWPLPYRGRELRLLQIGEPKEYLVATLRSNLEIDRMNVVPIRSTLK